LIEHQQKPAKKLGKHQGHNVGMQIKNVSIAKVSGRPFKTFVKNTDFLDLRSCCFLA
jgi:hypothetical protein